MGKPNLTDDERHSVVCRIFENINSGKVIHGTFNSLAIEFNVTRRTIHNLWKAAKVQRQHGVPINVKSRIPGKQGKPSIIFPFEAIKALDLDLRGTIESLAGAIGQSESTVGRWIKKGLLKSHTSTMHPLLTLENKYDRLQFVLSKLVVDRINKNLKFKEMDHIIHLDEKWFNKSKPTNRYLLVQEEETPYRCCKSKRFIEKFMFLTAVSRPIYDDNGAVLFDGKIGIFPLTYEEPAKRNSKNRVAGTMVTKPIESITKSVTKDFIINKVIPAIKSKWPETASKNIVIQQDNAKPHIRGNDIDFLHAATSDGFNIQLQQQPANSPDLNVLDLGFFRSIQSLQQKKRSKTVEQLIHNVQFAYETQKVECLDDVWLSWQACMIEILKIKGHNDYPLPHMQKDAQRRAGTLPRNLIVDEELGAESIAYLLKNRNTNYLKEMLRDIGVNMEAFEDIYMQ